jgi:copper transport protein
VTRDGLLRRLAGVLLAVPLALVAVLALGAGPVWAHALLTSTTPAQGSEVTTAPGAVSLTFTEEVGLSGRSVEVTDPRGHRVDDGQPSHPSGDGRTVRAGLVAGLAKGSYTVTWRVVSVDGHPVSGTFAFGVGVPAGAVPRPASADPVVGPLRTLTQLLSYAGTALLIGGSVFLFLLWPGGHDSSRLRRLMIAGVIVAGAGSVGSLLVQGPYVAGRSVAGLADATLLGETLGSSYGRPLVLRVLAVILAVPVLGIWPRLPGDEGTGAPAVAAAGNALLLAASFSLTGHAAEASPRWLAETADGVHLAAAGVWLGGLAVLLLAYLPESLQARVAVPAGARPPPAGSGLSPGVSGEVPALLRHWSRLATGAVSLLLVTGVYQGWRETRALDALTGTTYGQLLMTKAVLAAGLVVTAAVARSVVAGLPVVAGLARPPAARQPAPDGEPASALRRLRGVVAAEAALGAAVLGVTSYLVATPPARTSFGPPFSASIAGKDADGTMIRIALVVSPTRVGAQSVRLRAYTPTDEPLPFASATGELRPEGGAGPVRFSVTPIADGEGLASAVVVPSAGRWTLTVQVLTDATTDYAATISYLVH